MKYSTKPYYKRNLPHFQATGDNLYFVTFRLHNSLPRDVLENIKEEHLFRISQIEKSSITYEQKQLLIDEENRRYFGKFDKFLDTNAKGNHYFKIDSIAQIAYDALLFFHNSRYEIVCFTIMSNHIHLLVWLSDTVALYGIMHSLKRYIAAESNKILNKKEFFGNTKTMIGLSETVMRQIEL